MSALSGPINCTILVISGPSRNHQNGAVSGAINCKELAISGAMNSQQDPYLFLAKLDQFMGPKIARRPTDYLCEIAPPKIV